MKISSLLLREKTNVGRKTSITFNAPGNYVAPYGKTTVRIGGRGASGNAASGGNLASPAVPAVATGNAIEVDTARFTTPATPPLPPNTPNSNYAPNSQVSTWAYTYTSTSHPSYSSSGSFGPNGYSIEIFYSPTSFTPGSPANYNTYFPANTGVTSNIGGVTFPGGYGGIAPVIAQTTTTLAYSPSGLTVTVPTGGYITIDNV